eukprot:15252_1
MLLSMIGICFFVMWAQQGWLCSQSLVSFQRCKAQTYAAESWAGRRWTECSIPHQLQRRAQIKFSDDSSVKEIDQAPGAVYFVLLFGIHGQTRPCPPYSSQNPAIQRYHLPKTPPDRRTGRSSWR